MLNFQLTLQCFNSDVELELPGCWLSMLCSRSRQVSCAEIFSTLSQAIELFYLEGIEKILHQFPWRVTEFIKARHFSRIVFVVSNWIHRQFSYSYL